MLNGFDLSTGAIYILLRKNCGVIDVVFPFIKII